MFSTPTSMRFKSWEARARKSKLAATAPKPRLNTDTVKDLK